MAVRHIPRVGNALLYIGNEYEDRGLPRDSHGFEPFEAYFRESDLESEFSSTTEEESKVESVINIDNVATKEPESDSLNITGEKTEDVYIYSPPIVATKSPPTNPRLAPSKLNFSDSPSDEDKDDHNVQNATVVHEPSGSEVMLVDQTSDHHSEVIVVEQRGDSGGGRKPPLKSRVRATTWRNLDLDDGVSESEEETVKKGRRRGRRGMPPLKSKVDGVSESEEETVKKGRGGGRRRRPPKSKVGATTRKNLDGSDSEDETMNAMWNGSRGKVRNNLDLDGVSDSEEEAFGALSWENSSRFQALNHLLQMRSRENVVPDYEKKDLSQRGGIRTLGQSSSEEVDAVSHRKYKKKDPSQRGGIRTHNQSSSKEIDAVNHRKYKKKQSETKRSTRTVQASSEEIGAGLSQHGTKRTTRTGQASSEEIGADSSQRGTKRTTRTSQASSKETSQRRTTRTGQASSEEIGADSLQCGTTRTGQASSKEIGADSSQHGARRHTRQAPSEEKNDSLQRGTRRSTRGQSSSSQWFVPEDVSFKSHSNPTSSNEVRESNILNFKSRVAEDDSGSEDDGLHSHSYQVKESRLSSSEKRESLRTVDKSSGEPASEGDEFPGDLHSFSSDQQLHSHSNPTSSNQMKESGLEKRSESLRTVGEFSGASDRDELPGDVYSFSSADDNDVGPRLDQTMSPGGRKYRRLPLTKRSTFTPGVRRSRRTRIPPVQHWVNEMPEYERRESGYSLKNVLVPVEGGGEMVGKKRKKPTKVTETVDDDSFPPLKYSDGMGDQREEKIVHTLKSAYRVNGVGKEAQDDDDVIIARMHASSVNCNSGIITFSPYGVKEACNTKDYEMIFYVLEGKLLFHVSDQEFELAALHQAVITIPPGTCYWIKNLNRSLAKLYFTAVKDCSLT